MYKLSMVLIAVAITGCTDQRLPDESSDEQGLLTVTAGTLYSDGNFFGTSFTIGASVRGIDTDGDLPADFDDVASSITVRPLCTIELFTGPGQTGSSELFASDTNILPISLDNQVSSYRASCVPHCPLGTHWCGPDQGCTRNLCQ